MQILISHNFSSEQNKIDISDYIKSLTPDDAVSSKLLLVISEIRKHLQMNYKFQISSSKLKVCFLTYQFNRSSPKMVMVIG